MKTPSVEPVQRSRLLPRISFRTMFGLTTIGAVLAAIARAAGSGTSIAVGFLVMVGFLAACFAAFVLLFACVRVFSSIWYHPGEEKLEGNPFAEGQLPPQVLPPRDARQ